MGADRIWPPDDTVPEVFEAALERVSVRERAAIRLVFYDELTEDHAAEFLALTREQFDALLRRGLRRVRKEYLRLIGENPVVLLAPLLHLRRLYQAAADGGSAMATGHWARVGANAIDLVASSAVACAVVIGAGSGASQQGGTPVAVHRPPAKSEAASPGVGATVLRDLPTSDAVGRPDGAPAVAVRLPLLSSGAPTAIPEAGVRVPGIEPAPLVYVPDAPAGVDDGTVLPEVGSHCPTPEERPGTLEALCPSSS